MTPLKKKSSILQRTEIERLLARMAHEIVERNQGLTNVVLVGIRTGGAILVDQLAQMLRKIESTINVPVGVVDITLYRDDLTNKIPIVRTTDIPFGIEDRDLVLVDDILFTGRTIRSALDAIIDLGRPKTIQLAVLIDRGHRELPIQGDYVGKRVETRHDEHLKLLIHNGQASDVVLYQQESSS